MTPVGAVELFVLQRSEDAREVVLALLRRDWAVRVLDAWARDEEEVRWWQSGPDQLQLYRHDEDGAPEVFDGADEDAARLAAAKTIYPTLPDTVRAQLGEAP